MCIELEQDEKSYYFRWKNIEGSEDYNLLKKGGCSIGEDHFETWEYAQIISYFQRVVPHIRWRYTFNDTDQYGARPSQWRVICVPDDQFSEAKFIFDRFLNRDNLENYSYTDRYPEIYHKIPNGQSKLMDDIFEFHELLLEYEETLFSKKLALASFFKKLATLLPQMYLYADSLPYVSEASNLKYQGTMPFDRDLNLSPYDEFFNVPAHYDTDMETFLLSDLLLSIYEDIEQGLIAFSTNQPDLIAGAVNEWIVGFSAEHGWGRDILTALLGIHQAKRKIKNK